MLVESLEIVSQNRLNEWDGRFFVIEITGGMVTALLLLHEALFQSTFVRPSITFEALPLCLMVGLAKELLLPRKYGRSI